MKFNTQSLILVSMAMQGLLHGEQGYTNTIEMVEQGFGDEPPLLWNLQGTVAAEGSNVLVGAPVPENGALFILSTIETSPFNDWFIDQASVGAHLPQAEIELVTHDKVSTTPMVRADQPIQVKVKVSELNELPADLGVPIDAFQQATTEVRLLLYSQAYAEGEASLPGGEVTNDAQLELALVGNGEFPKNAKSSSGEAEDLVFYTSLNPSMPELARGEEHFVVNAVVGSSGGIEIGAALDQARVQVWPVWSGWQSGLMSPKLLPYNYSGNIPENIARVDGELAADENFVLSSGEVGYDLGDLPDITFTWQNLYPTSSIALIVNDASIPYPWGGRLISGTRKQFNEDSDFSATQKISGVQWENLFEGQGRYAIWMVTNTPGIGWEVAGNYSGGKLKPGGWVMPIEVEVISVRASIQSLK